MSECEGEKQWIGNPKENSVYGCVGKGTLLSNAGYHSPLLAQLLFSPSWYVFHLRSVGEQFLRVGK